MKYYLTQFLLPILADTPSHATVKSHKLMLQAGYIRQVTSGIYTWLPLGKMLLDSITEIIRNSCNQAGLCEILMPTIQPGSIWNETNRYDSYGKEMLKIKDRHENNLVYGPTNEEAITDLFRNNIQSYKQLPLILYHIQWKFRDEIRPRFGTMRGREFLMKDSYSFDVSKEKAVESYKKHYQLYYEIFEKIGCDVIAVQADNGAIGGNLSHEYHIPCETGESNIIFDPKLKQNIEKQNYDYDENSQYIAHTDEIKVENPNNVQLVTQKSIEVAHIFNFGVKYSQAMNAKILSQTAEHILPYMGSYGIGISRLAAAIIEKFSDSKGICLPKQVSKVKIIVVILDVTNQEVQYMTKIIENILDGLNIIYLVDDTKHNVKTKLNNADIIGVPYQIIIGKNIVKNKQIQIKKRIDNKIVEMKPENLTKYLQNEIVVDF